MTIEIKRIKNVYLFIFQDTIMYPGNFSHCLIFFCFWKKRKKFNKYEDSTDMLSTSLRDPKSVEIAPFRAESDFFYQSDKVRNKYITTWNSWYCLNLPIICSHHFISLTIIVAFNSILFSFYRIRTLYPIILRKNYKTLNFMF